MTTVLTGPGSANPIAGQFLAPQDRRPLGGRDGAQGPRRHEVCPGENPKSVYNDRKETPVTRMATAALIREHLAKAQEYQDKQAKADGDPDQDMPDYDAKLEALVPVVAGELPAHFHAHRADDIATAVRLSREFGLKLVVVHGTGGLSGARAAGGGGGAGHHRALPHRPLQAGAGGPDPGQPGPAPPGGGEDRHLHRPPGNAHPVPPPLRGYGGAGGLDPEEALAAITSSAAEIAGLSKRVGTLTPGKDADVVVTSGHPFDWNGSIRAVFLNGRRVK